MAGSVEMLKFVTVVTFLFGVASAGNFYQDVNLTWGAPRAQIQNGGQLLSMTLDQISGCGWESRNEFLYGRFDVQLKLVPGNSAGTVTTFFLSSQGATHDEIDFEFLGNSSGEPYTVHTNVFVQGVGDKEEQFRLWFDPTIDFHNYTIIWNSQRIIWMVDYIIIRVFNNNEASGIPFPTFQPMKVYASIWEADEWATQGGRVKTDWSMAPFTAYYKDFNANACIVSGSWNSCNSGTMNNDQAWQTKGLDENEQNGNRWVQQQYRISNYCDQPERFPNGLPRECSIPAF